MRHDTLLGTLVICSAVLSLVQLAKCAPRVQYHQTFPVHNDVDDNNVRYNYRYSIDDSVSGVVTDKWEERRGNFVKGAYSLLEPGGKVRVVDYQVDGDRGFQAIVKTVYPGHYLYSTQQFLKSQEIHPQAEPELALGPSYPSVDHPDDTLPVNYHALNAEYIGFQRLFGRPPSRYDRRPRFRESRRRRLSGY